MWASCLADAKKSTKTAAQLELCESLIQLDPNAASTDQRGHSRKVRRGRTRRTRHTMKPVTNRQPPPHGNHWTSRHGACYFTWPEL